MKVILDNVDFNFKFKCGFICFLFVCYNIIYMLLNCYVIDFLLWFLDKLCVLNKFNVFYVG